MGAKTDKIFGRAKQALGAITGNETMKREGAASRGQRQGQAHS